MYLKNVGLFQGVLPYIEYSFFLLLNAINQGRFQGGAGGGRGGPAPPWRF